MTTDEFNESKKALSLASNALQEIGSGFGEFYTALSSGMEENNDLGTVFQNPKIKSSISKIGGETSKSTQEISTAAKLFSRAVGSKLSGSNNFNEAFAETIESVKVLLVSTTFIVTQVVNDTINKQDRLLPPSKS